MRSYEASTLIHAKPDVIWEILTNTGNYEAWDPSMLRVEGTIAPDQEVKFFTKYRPNQAFPVKVTAFAPPRTMAFSGGMPMGLFKSERTHTLTPQSDGSTHFHTKEIFSGPLLFIVGRSIPDLTRTFERFAAGLKEQAEGGKGGSGD